MPLPPTLRTLVRHTPTVAPVPHRGVLSISGSQASEFLHGIIAGTVHQPVKRPFYSAFLHAQGRVEYDVFLYTTTNEKGGQDYLLDYDPRPSEATPLLSLMKRYVLRSKVKIRDVSDQYDVWAAWGSRIPEPARHWTYSRSGATEPKWEGEEWPWGSEDMTILDRRAIGMGKRLLARKGEKPQQASDHDVLSSDAYTLHRILHGVPEGQIDIPPMQAFPMDSNLDLMGAINFRKGCYVGQELTVRTYHTGVVRKRILPVLLHKPDKCLHSEPQNMPEFAPNLDLRPTVIQQPGGEGRRPRPRGTGKLLTSQQGVGLALMRLEQIEAVERGEMRLDFDASGGEGKDIWTATHWWPDWWPKGPTPQN